VTIPASVTDIVSPQSNSMFRGCSGLTSITVDANNPNYASEGGILYNKAKTTLIRAPQAGISGDVTIPDSVTSIDQSAFNSCTGLTSVTIPSSVTFIGNNAFTNSTSLTSVTFQGTIASDNFDSLSFSGDLRTKYLAAGGGIGTYTTTNPGSSPTWTKQP